MLRKFALLAVLIAPVCSFGQVLNEIRIDEADAQDPNEYVEIGGTPGLPLTGMTLVVIGDGNGQAGSGVIEEVVSLGAASLPTDGHLVVGQSTLTLATPDVTDADLNLEDGDTLTFLIVTGFSGADGQDLDTNNDGTLDVSPWLTVVDSVAVVVTGSAELPYSATRIGPQTPDVVHIERCPSVLGSWRVAPEVVSTTNDSPGASNPCPAEDAGISTDAGTDGGSGVDGGSTFDGGVADAGTDGGVETDAGEIADAGEAGDAGETVDAGEELDGGEADAGTRFDDGGVTGGGCGCTSVPVVELMALFAVAALIRRRRS